MNTHGKLEFDLITLQFSKHCNLHKKQTSDFKKEGFSADIFIKDDGSELKIHT